MCEALQQQSSLKIDEINTILNKKNAFPILQSLLDQKAIVVEQEVLDKYKPKLIRCVKIHSDYEPKNALTKQYQKLFEIRPLFLTSTILIHHRAPACHYKY